MPPIDLPNMTDTQKILTMLRDGLISHDTRIQGIRDDVNDNKKDLDMLKATVLMGDTAGHPSHAERIRNLETYVEGTKDAMKYWGRVIGGMLLTLLGTVFWAIVKLLPVLEKIAAQQP